MAPDPEVVVQGEVLALVAFGAHHYDTRRRSWSCRTSVLPDGTILAATEGRVPRTPPTECCCGDRSLVADPAWRADLLAALEATELYADPLEAGEGVSPAGRSAVVLTWPHGVRHVREPGPILALVCSACDAVGPVPEGADTSGLPR